MINLQLTVASWAVLFPILAGKAESNSTTSSSFFENCNLCSDGSVPSQGSNSTFQLWLGGDSYSCSDYAMIEPGTIPPFEGDYTDDVGDACAFYSMIGYTFCGCPEPPKLSESLENCNFCWSSSSLPTNFDPNALAKGFDDYGINCGTFLATVVSNSDYFCPSEYPGWGEPKEHYDTAVNCGCEAPTGCATCSDGEFFNYYKNTLVDIKGEYFTCDSLKEFSIYPDVCPEGVMSEEYGNECCQQPCHACPPTSPDIGEYFVPYQLAENEYEVEPGLAVTCKEMSEDPIKPNYGQDNVCPDGVWHSELKETCCGSCTICADGSSPTPNATVFDSGTFWNSENNYPNFPCESYIAETQFSESCDFYHVMGYLYCGCPDPGLSTHYEDCPFCYNSTSLSESFDPSKKLGPADDVSPNSTCGRRAAEIATNGAVSGACNNPYEVWLQTSISHEACGCESQSPRYECNREKCQDISLEDPMPMYEVDGRNFSCYDLLFRPVNDDICPGGEPSEGFLKTCGCNTSGAVVFTESTAAQALPMFLLAALFSFF